MNTLVNATRLPDRKKRLIFGVLTALMAVVILTGSALILFGGPGGNQLTGSGQAKTTYVAQASELPEGFPADFPRLAGAKLVSAFVQQDIGRRSFSVKWSTAADLDSVLRYFEQSLPDKYSQTDFSQEPSGGWILYFDIAADSGLSGSGSIDASSEAGTTIFSVNFDLPK